MLTKMVLTNEKNRSQGLLTLSSKFPLHSGLPLFSIPEGCNKFEVMLLISSNWFEIRNLCIQI